jgi:hypothetical protein
MSGEPGSLRTKLHPGHHWGPFARDPWSPDLDPVVGEVWERAARGGRVAVRRPAHEAPVGAKGGDGEPDPP